MTEHGGPTLEYAHPQRVIPSDALHKIARFCGIAPLCVGVSIYVLYLITRWFGFGLIGLLALGLGGICFGIGIICLGWYRYQVARADVGYAAAGRRNFWIDLVILLVNLPVAAFCAFNGMAQMTGDELATVTIDNQSSSTITNLTISAPGLPEAVVKTVPLGMSHVLSSRVTKRQLRSLRYKFIQGGSEHAGSPTPMIGMGHDELFITIRDSGVTFRTDDF